MHKGIRAYSPFYPQVMSIVKELRINSYNINFYCMPELFELFTINHHLWLEFFLKF